MNAGELIADIKWCNPNTRIFIRVNGITTQVSSISLKVEGERDGEDGYGIGDLLIEGLPNFL